VRNGYFTGIGIAREKFAGRIIYQCGEFLSSLTQRRDLGYPDGTSIMLFLENIESETHDRSGEGAAIRFSRRRPIENRHSGPDVVREGWVQMRSVV